MSVAVWLKVCVLSDIPLRGSRRLNCGQHRIALFRTAADSVYALQDSCPHKAGPLSEGIVHGNCVTCPLHNWDISLETGIAQGADIGSTQTFPVRIEGSSILLELPVTDA